MITLDIDLFWETKSEAIKKLNWYNNNVHRFKVKIDPVDPNSSLHKTKLAIIKELRNMDFVPHSENDLIWYKEGGR